MTESRPVAVATLLAAGVQPHPHEAVAIVLQLCGQIARRGPAPRVTPAISTSTVCIDASGAVAVSGGESGEDEQTVSLAGRLLVELLDHSAAALEGAALPRLRATALRAASSGRAAFGSVSQLVSALRRYGPEVRRSRGGAGPVRALGRTARLADGTGATPRCAPTSSVERRYGPSTRFPASAGWSRAARGPAGRHDAPGPGGRRRRLPERRAGVRTAGRRADLPADACAASSSAGMGTAARGPSARWSTRRRAPVRPARLASSDGSELTSSLDRADRSRPLASLSRSGCASPGAASLCYTAVMTRVATLCLILCLAVSAACARPAHQAPARVRSADLHLTPETETVSGLVPDRSTLADILEDAKLRADLVPPVVQLAGSVFDPRRLKAGRAFRLERTFDGLVRRFEYDIDEDRFLRILGPTNRQPEELTVELVPFEKTRTTMSVQGTISKASPSLFEAMEEAGEGPDLSLALAEIFGGELDFNSDLQPNDTLPADVREGLPRRPLLVLRPGARGRVRQRGAGAQGHPLHGAWRKAGLLRRTGAVAQAVLPGFAAEVRRARQLEVLACAAPPDPANRPAPPRRGLPGADRAAPWWRWPTARWCRRAGAAKRAASSGCGTPAATRPTTCTCRRSP